MNQQRTQSLFDLLARSWQRPAAIDAAVFNRDLSAAAFAGADGTIAIARVGDPESALSRVRISADLGQNTIRPRTREPKPLVATEPFGPAAVPLAACRGADFLVGTAAGDVLRLEATGETRSTGLRFDAAVIAIDHAAGTGLVAVTDGTDLVLWRGDGHQPWMPAFGGGHPIGALAFSSSGRLLAVSRGEGLSILEISGEGAQVRSIRLAGRPTSFAWSGDDRHVAAPLAGGGFALVDLESGRVGSVTDFPDRVRTVAFSGPADAVIASGAFRVAGWSMRRPPIGEDTQGAIATGRAGLVLVESAAAHPSKPLAAAGYANGQIVIAAIGGRDELVVKASGAPVTVLAWSADGRHLAAGGTDGTISLITFPPQMFK